MWNGTDELLFQLMSRTPNAGFGFADIQRIGNQLVGVFTKLTGVVRAIIIGFALLVATFYAVYFLKKDRSGSEEGKSGLMRVAQSIFVAVAIALLMSALAGWLQTTFK